MKRRRQQQELAWQAPEQHTKVLLHACCAPCSGAIVEGMLAHGLTPTLYYCNPNIYPAEEYRIRRDECARFAAETGIDMIEAPYDHAAWLCAVKGLEHEPERGSRCRRCFEMRLESAARYAAAHGFAVIATTLASSRWKRLDQISEAAAEATACTPGVIFWNRNWRKGGLQQRRGEIIRERGFYNQLYCGCEFSMQHNDHDKDETI